jgi:hypothetical protein
MAKIRIDPPQLTNQDIQRFWSKVDKSPGQGPRGDCWKWTRGRKAGYGDFSVRHRNYYAHRVAFLIDRGYWPALHVCHKCDWPLCCNPIHLFEGTDADNLHDMSVKGRSCRGEKQGNSKLTAEDVREIRSRYRPRVITQKQLANEYGVTRSHICLILKRRRTWLHI